MQSEPITSRQLTTLHTLYALYARRSLDIAPDKDRVARLQWLGQICGRAINSAKELNISEAAAAIDALQLALGNDPKRYARPVSRDAARAAGTHGRRGFKTNELAIASEADLARIHDALHRLGWDQAHFEAWLSSSTSPVRGLSALQQIHTVAQANKIWWALKNMLRRSGRWRAA